MIYYGLLLIGFILVLWAQTKISSTYNKYKKVNLKQTLSGQEIARKILDANGLENVYIVQTNGELTDHYDPKRKVVRLSKGVFNAENVSAAAIAAHEVGHAIQDKENYSYMKIRAFLVPFVSFVTYLGYIGLAISIFAGITSYIQVSIIVLVVVLLFQLVTLPVEFDASKRAKEQLLSLGLIDEQEHTGVEKVLNAAAFTYIAGFISNLLQLLRIVLMFRRND